MIQDEFKVYVNDEVAERDDAHLMVQLVSGSDLLSRSYASAEKGRFHTSARNSTAPSPGLQASCRTQPWGLGTLQTQANAKNGIIVVHMNVSQSSDFYNVGPRHVAILHEGVCVVIGTLRWAHAHVMIHHATPKPGHLSGQMGPGW